MSDDNPLNETVLHGLFQARQDGIWVMSSREDDTIECKASFHKSGHGWLRSVAALANNRGGYILFGVKDMRSSSGDYVLHGLKNSNFNDTDSQEISRLLRGVFDPTPRFKMCSIQVSGMSIGVIYVYQHPTRPIICTTTLDQIIEGEIYYRYPGESAKIKHSELRSIMDDREGRVRAELAPMLERLFRLGPDNAMVADLRDSLLIDGKTFIRIDDDIINDLNLIREGHFVEDGGAPAYKLVGEIHLDDGSSSPIKSLIHVHDMLFDFLKGQCRAKPIDYIHHALSAQYGRWLPIFYFSGIAGISDVDLCEMIKDSSGSPELKKKFVSRINRTLSAYKKPTGTPAALLSTILNGDVVNPTDVNHASAIGMAIQGMDYDADETLYSIFKETCLISLRYLISHQAEGTCISNIRRAVARLDEVIYHRPAIKEQAV